MTWRPLPQQRDRDARPLGPSLERIAAGLGVGRPELLTTVFARWAELVGPDVAAHATPRTLRDGVLTVSVDHPAWATSLRMLTGDLLARIDAESGAGAGSVRELVVQVEGTGRRGPRSRPR